MTDIFFSPHPDDIAYSCFGPIYLSQNKRVIVTVFSVSRYAYNSTKNDVFEITKLRKNEEECFAQRMSSELFFLDYADSSITMLSPVKYNDLNIEVEQIIQNLIMKYYPCNVYIPIALGWHLDHMRLRDILISVVKKCSQFVNQVFFYEDLPYACDYNTLDYHNEIKKMELSMGICSLEPLELNISAFVEQWKINLKTYKSQLNQFEYDRMIAYKKKNEQYFERIWKMRD